MRHEHLHRVSVDKEPRGVLVEFRDCGYLVREDRLELEEGGSSGEVLVLFAALFPSLDDCILSKLSVEEKVLLPEKHPPIGSTG